MPSLAAGKATVVSDEHIAEYVGSFRSLLEDFPLTEMERELLTRVLVRYLNYHAVQGDLEPRP